MAASQIKCLIAFQLNALLNPAGFTGPTGKIMRDNGCNTFQHGFGG